MADLVIGIELSNSNICACLYQNGDPKILETSEGSKTMPVLVFSTEFGQTLSGKHAMHLASIKPERGIQDIDQLIGKKISDPEIQNKIKNFPFTVQANENDDPIIVMKQGTGSRKLIYTPKDVYIIIFRNIKKDIETNLKRIINKVVLTVPSYFNKEQREVISAAARNAGFSVLQILNRPTAAAIYHYSRENFPENNYSMVCYLGRRSFEVAVLKPGSNTVEEIHFESTTNFGGRNFDDLIINYANDEVKRLYNCELKTNKNLSKRLHHKCEEAKKKLSISEETKINFYGCFTEAPQMELTVTRKKFEELCNHYFRSILEVIHSCIENSEINKNWIKEIILVGGSSQIPKIQAMISSYFEGGRLKNCLNPDECVAKGTAIYGGMLSKHKDQFIKKLDISKPSMCKENRGKYFENKISVTAATPEISTHSINAAPPDKEAKKMEFHHDPAMDNIVIGIDLGTTNSCVSVYMDGKMKVLENVEGDRTTPSFVYFKDARNKDVVVGKHAKKIAIPKPQRGIYEVKRLIGRKFDDPNLQRKLKYFPFKVESDKENNPIIVIDDNVRKSPQEICSIILTKMKNDVQGKFNAKINKAVITVPAYFNVQQREATMTAAKDAGFTEVKLLNEPTAAALSYYSESDKFDNSYSMVYDLGGGTFDVAILRRINKDIEIIAVDGDTELGGQDFDNNIMNYVCDEIKNVYNCDLLADKLTLRRIHNKCEEAKKTLSTIDETIIYLTGFLKEYPSIEITLTRETLEQLCEELFQKTIDIVDNCINSRNISKEDIGEVILCGGSTRIPKIKEMLSEYFNGKHLNKFVNPDEAVSEGAAIHAAMLSTNPQQKIEKVKLTDVIPLSLGSASLGHKMNILIKRNSPIPIKAWMPYANLHGNETSINFEIYEGERADTRKNRFLGAMEISDITPSPPGQCKVILTLSVDENSILTVTAKEETRDNTRQLQVNYARSTRSEKEVENALLDSQKSKKEDERFIRFVDQKIHLMKFCSAMAYNLNEKKLTGRHMDIYDLCREFYHRAKMMEVENEKELKEMIFKIKEKCKSYIEMYKFEIVA